MHMQAFGILVALALAVQAVWMLLFLLFGWNKKLPTTSIFSGVVKGVETEVKEAL